MAPSLVIFALLAHSTVAIRRNSVRLQPEVVAHSLAAVEEEWKQQADAFVECNDTAKDGDEAEACRAPAEGFEKSCSKIVAAVVQSSDGERGRVTEYLNVICGEKELGTGWKQQQCKSLADVITSKMSAEPLNNRETFDSEGLCKKIWPQFLSMEQDAVRKERAERLEKARKEAEEKAAREKKEAEERAERERKEAEERAAAEKAAAEAKKQAEEEEAKRQEAAKAAEQVRIHKAKAEEAKRKAQEAAERLAKKKAEAQQMEEEAAQHQKEAAAAAEEASRVEAQHNKKVAAAHVNNTEAHVQANTTQNETKAVLVNATHI